MTITLPLKLAEQVRLHVESGDYRNEDHVVADALAALEAVRAQLQMRRAEFARRIDEADRGLAEPLDVETMISRLQDRTNDACKPL